MLFIPQYKRVLSKSIVQVGLAGVAGVLAWANWQEPSLHDYPVPVSVGVVQLLAPAPDTTGMHHLVAALPGVTACTVSADARSLAFTYHPSEVTPEQVQQQLPAAWHGHLYQASAAAMAGPQCPVPQGYVVALERLRFALNLRRLFVKV